MSNFVPTGFLNLFTAVWELARAREVLPDTAFMQDLDRLEAAHRLHVTALAELRDPPDFVERPDLNELRALRAQQADLNRTLAFCWLDVLQALGDGRFRGYVLSENGLGAEVPLYVWRADGVPQSAFPSGRIGWLEGTPSIWIEGRIVLDAPAFATWVFGPMPLVTPAQGNEEPDVPAVPDTAEEAEEEERRSGGRPPHVAMDGFIREMLRIADRPDGLPDGPELTRHMLEWAERAFENRAPGVSTIRAWIARFDHRRPAPKRYR